MDGVVIGHGFRALGICARAGLLLILLLIVFAAALRPRTRKAIIRTGRSASWLASRPAAATTSSRAGRPEIVATDRSAGGDREPRRRGGRLAAEYVSHQPADGYTLLLGASGATSIASAIYPIFPTSRPRPSFRLP